MMLLGQKIPCNKVWLIRVSLYCNSCNKLNFFSYYFYILSQCENSTYCLRVHFQLSSESPVLLGFYSHSSESYIPLRFINLHGKPWMRLIESMWKTNLFHHFWIDPLHLDCYESIAIIYFHNGIISRLFFIQLWKGKLLALFQT